MAKPSSETPRARLPGESSVFEQRRHAPFTFNEVDADRLCNDLYSLMSFDRPPAVEEHQTVTHYLDTEDLALYRLAADGVPPNDRILQVRLRSYGSRRDGPVYFETKWQTGSVAHKRRLTLTPEQAALLQAGGPVAANAIEQDEVDPRFGEILNQIVTGRLTTKVVVQYHRRAYQTTSRVTVDTEIVYTRWPEQLTIHPNYGVLEVKSPTGGELSQFINKLARRSPVTLGRPVSKFIEATRLLYDTPEVAS